METLLEPGLPVDMQSNSSTPPKGEVIAAMIWTAAACHCVSEADFLFEGGGVFDLQPLIHWPFFLNVASVVGSCSPAQFGMR